MDISTITFLAGLVSCFIGIATFIVGMNSRAQKSGAMEQKLNQAVSGIEEIKTDLRSTSQAQNQLALTTKAQDEQIKNLMEKVGELEREQHTINSKLEDRNRLNNALVAALERLGKGV